MSIVSAVVFMEKRSAMGHFVAYHAYSWCRFAVDLGSALRSERAAVLAVAHARLQVLRNGEKHC